MSANPLRYMADHWHCAALQMLTALPAGSAQSLQPCTLLCSAELNLCESWGGSLLVVAHTHAVLLAGYLTDIYRRAIVMRRNMH